MIKRTRIEEMAHKNEDLALYPQQPCKSSLVSGGRAGRGDRKIPRGHWPPTSQIYELQVQWKRPCQEIRGRVTKENSVNLWLLP